MTTAPTETTEACAPAAVATRRPARVTGLGAITMRLTRARFDSGQGELLLYGATVLAATVGAAIGYTLAGGTWMFYRRSVAPTGLLAELVTDASFRTILDFYVGLAAFACALVLPALVSLVAAGAQLGARGRERRLASLRLLGLSARDVTRMALLDSVAQTVAGTVLGFLVYLLTLPLWGRMAFQAMPISSGEMLLPWWLALGVGVALVLLGLGASAWGLRQVRISPLGVSRRAGRPAVRAWRFVLLVVAVVVATVVVPKSLRTDGAMFVFAGVVVLLLAGANLAGPWFLQLSARPLTRVGSPVVLTAARRIIADPAATWRRVSTLGVLAFVSGYLGMVPFSFDPASAKSAAEATFMDSARADFARGAAITLIVGFTLTATSLLITQASATLERAEQSRALRRLGAPRSFDLQVMWLDTFAPLLLSTVLGAGLGVWAAAPMARMIRESGLDQGSGGTTVATALAAGLAVAAVALLASHPLHRRVLGADERRAD